MPKLFPSHSSPSSIRCLLHASPPAIPPVPRAAYCQTFVSSPLRPLAQPRHGILDDPFTLPSPTFFSRSSSRGLDGIGGSPNNDYKPPDERVLKLGKTLRTLSPLLPSILINPLPPKILSPNVALDLFPSTHPHLPTVRGRTLYRAALWTVPVAWSSVPLVGNVKLQILSERIVRAGTVLDPDRCDNGQGGDERLVVRWKTDPKRDNQSDGSLATSPDEGPSSWKPSNLSSSKIGINKGLSTLLGGETPIFKLSKEEQFMGLFIFAFDEEGRILTHTIEHADNASGWDRTAKFVTLTDWLIGKARGSLDPTPGLAMQSSPSFDLHQRPQGHGFRHHTN
ncbi:hypothetical protein PHISCL_05150 [Aspergillus sclerotialis]|uniref:Chromosome transmission fidelity protein 4 n=1 Tax=Aspergillus sclerotialis TaxID=2070753 RepID=A0A3A2ZM83_9EURO|nr:hypothetical protein PHISCL_05150 [Aspergillus sclerotialis]